MSPHFLFTTSEQIRQALFRIDTLDANQRELLAKKFVVQLDQGGVTFEEVKRVIEELRSEHLISEVDAKLILEVARERQAGLE